MRSSKEEAQIAEQLRESPGQADSCSQSKDIKGTPHRAGRVQLRTSPGFSHWKGKRAQPQPEHCAGSQRSATGDCLPPT